MTSNLGRIDSPVTLVTGTSSGMGLHTAIELSRRGHTVIATMRDTTRATSLQAAANEAGVDLDVRALDVVDHESARACVESVLSDHGHIDVLVNNAGRGAVGTAEQLSIDDVRDQLEVNYVGPVALTKLVLPGMRERRSGRVLTITSVGGAVGQPFADSYCGAKFAVEGFMQSLAPVAETFGVWVSVVEPAAVASDFVGSALRTDDGRQTRPAASGTDNSRATGSAGRPPTVPRPSSACRSKTSTASACWGSPAPGSHPPDPASAATHRVALPGGRRGPGDETF